MKSIKIFCILALLLNICYAKDITYLKSPNLSVNTPLRASVMKQHWGLDYFIMEQTKRCSSCRNIKPLYDYHKNAGRFDGIHTTCKKCMSESYRRRRGYAIIQIPDLPDEEWQDVEGYTGFYKVSNLGRIKSILRKVKTAYGYRVTKPMIIKGSDSGGYKTVMLTKEDNRKYLLAHRLVAVAFLPNPNNLAIVNHLDCNGLNNKVSNLEWTTYTGNLLYAIRLGRTKTGADHPAARAVEQYDLEGVLVRKYVTIKEASVTNNKIIRTGISRCCRGEIKTSGGYIWRYAI